MSKNYLVLTATVTPAVGIGNTIRSDPLGRLKEYLAAYEFYCRLPDNLVDGIVIMENSGQNLDIFKDISKRKYSTKKFFFISTSQSYPAENGKGYGEFFMLDQGMRFLQEKGVSRSTQIWKITGRLIVKNIIDIILSSPKNFDVYADFRHVPFLGRHLGGNEWLELRLIAFSSKFYDQYFRGHYGDGYVIEYAFFDRLFPIVKHRPLNMYPRFKIQPQLVGVSGYSNKSYSSAEYIMKTIIRGIFRKLWPNFWL